MWQRTAAIVLTVIYGVGLIQPMVPLIVYAARTAAIVELFCENRERPEMKCNGMCHLHKQMDQAREEERERPPVVVLAAAPAIVPAQETLSEPAATTCEPVAHYLPAPGEPHPNALFHPPRG